MKLEAGPHDALVTTPPQAPSSARRTTSIDITRPDGFDADLVAVCRGRDRVVDPDGVAEAVGEVAFELRIGPTGDLLGFRSSISCQGSRSSCENLVGASLWAGFGRRVAHELGDDLVRRTLEAVLLEDLSGAHLVSGYAPLRAGLLSASAMPEGERGERQADICAGWARGAPLHDALATHAHLAVPMGPTAPVLERRDPGGWHQLAPMGEGTVRRRRQLDVSRVDHGLAVRAHFRDSWAGEGTEEVMHEYGVEAAVDAAGRVAAVAVEPLVLPWRECPSAVDSAQRIVGVAVADLPARVRADFVGTSTCTHLNSTLRSLADIAAVASLLT